MISESYDLRKLSFLVKKDLKHPKASKLINL